MDGKNLDPEYFVELDASFQRYHLEVDRMNGGGDNCDKDEKAASPVRVFSGELARSGNFER